MDGGLTAMHVAASLGDADTLQLLVEADEAAVNMVAEDGNALNSDGADDLCIWGLKGLRRWPLPEKLGTWGLLVYSQN